MLRYPQINWTVFSLCRQKDSDRAPKFKKACKLYRAQSIISDLEDEDIMTVKDSIPEIKEHIIKLLKTKKFDYLFTHGANGEYGHFRHIGVHKAVKDLLKQKKLAASQVFYFCYQGKNRGDGSHCLNDFKKAQYIVNLNPAELSRKRKIVCNLYGFSKESFEYKSCLRKETFYCNF
ncbi:hypothetical protein L6279_00170 [Candidatus Parcubacteria bacterium]|nr:hypothetical protein [Candidatus Parcubacteria bacterium]